MDFLTDLVKGQILNKATIDSTVNANYYPQDLSKVIYLNGAPPAPFLQRLAVGDAVGNPHTWNQIALSAPTGTSSYFPETVAPATGFTDISPKSNTIFRAGKSVEITDQAAALYSKPGGYQLSEASRSRWFKESMALQMNLKTRELINELDWIFINGDKTVTIPLSSGAQDVQCDGLLKFLENNVEDASTADITDDILVDLAEKIYNQYTGRNPQVLYVTSGQKKIVNGWATNVWFTRNRDLEAGKDVSTFNTGFFVLDLEIEPNMPSGTCAMVDHTLMKKMDLIPMTAEGLARVGVTIRRMITYYGSFECGNDRSSGKVIGLNQ